MILTVQRIQIKSKLIIIVHFNLSSWYIADNPETLVGTTVVGVGVRTGIEGGLGADTLDVVVGKVCCNVALTWTTGDGRGTGELELLADHISLLEETNVTFSLWPQAHRNEKFNYYIGYRSSSINQFFNKYYCIKTIFKS